MYSNDIKDQFAQLRAKGLSLARIATDIHVSQRTLVGWNRQLAPDIRALRAAYLEALHEQTLASRETDLARLAKIQINVEAALTERDFSWVDSCAISALLLPRFSALHFHNPFCINHFHFSTSPVGAILLHLRSPAPCPAEPGSHGLLRDAARPIHQRGGDGFVPGPSPCRPRTSGDEAVPAPGFAAP